MKNLLLVLGASALLLGWPIPSGTLAQDPARPIAGLQADGWRITEKREEKQTLPGIAPYENLTRVVQVVHYRLEKGNALMVCTATYDSQRDKYDETCRPGSK